MKFEVAISLVPSDCLANGLYVNEESVIDEVKGNGFALQAAYRLIARRIKGMNPRESKSLLKWSQVPQRFKLADAHQQQISFPSEQMAMFPETRECRTRHNQPRISRSQFNALRERIEAMVREAGEFYLALKPYTQMEMFDGLDTPEQRERRIRYYARQNRRIEKQFGIPADPSSRRGPAARPVWCRETPESEILRTFPSGRKAAEWLRTERGVYVRRSDIRTSIRKGHRCAGLTWGYQEQVKVKKAAAAKEEWLLFAAA